MSIHTIIASRKSNVVYTPFQLAVYHHLYLGNELIIHPLLLNRVHVINRQMLSLIYNPHNVVDYARATTSASSQTTDSNYAALDYL